MQATKDIENIEDIKLLVNTFYGKIREDDLLKDIFNNVIQDRWPEHLEKMYRFWQTILLDEFTYSGAPFPPHASLPVTAIHFERWVKIFNEVVDGFFAGERAERAKWQGNRMAEIFLSKINYLQYQNSI
ncbi:MAG: group III truncated hemoglobin [Bacteroidia bacterium]|nr:group III truncated hemoglobin [Bacteroidia bacterium]MCZ2140779.1 group III truncated hemoglobin [Bacteroidia bacterium]